MCSYFWYKSDATHPKNNKAVHNVIGIEGNRSSRLDRVFSKNFDLILAKCLTCCPVALILLPWKVTSQLRVPATVSGGNWDVIPLRYFPSLVLMAVICETADETAGCITDKSKCCFWKTRLRYVSIGMTSIFRPMVTTHSYFLRAFSKPAALALGAS